MKISKTIEWFIVRFPGVKTKTAATQWVNYSKPFQMNCFIWNGAIFSEFSWRITCFFHLILFWSLWKYFRFEKCIWCFMLTFIEHGFLQLFYRLNVSTEFKRIQEASDLVDITFSCDGKQFGAHKLVLFACSPYFKEVLKVIALIGSTVCLPMALMLILFLSIY